MSWSFDLCDPVSKKVLSVEEKHHIKGSSYADGGDTALTLDVTYNYSDLINNALRKYLEAEGQPIKEGYAYLLSGKTGAESIPILKGISENLGDDVDEDYWKATEGNAKRAVCGLLAFAQMRPDGVWNVC